MKTVAETYGKRFFKKRHTLWWRTEVLCPVIQTVLQPRNLIDLGCGNGDFAKWFLDHGVDAYGIEGSMEASDTMMLPADHVFYLDLRKPVTLHDAPLDLAISVEVAEHIEPEYAAEFVANCCRLSDRLMLTIAGPGQKGTGHVNLQPIAYWEYLFGLHNYRRNNHVENILKLGLNHKHRWTQTIRNNLVYFRRSNDD